ncbi:MAG TPA: DUF4112 domain-containing protein [Kofleriaceae bacterium]
MPNELVERERDVELMRVRRVARILDDGFIDPLLGFFLPGVGDLIGSLLGLYVVGLALRRKVAPIIIARMFLNLAIDAGVGSIPVLGDVFDIVYRANNKNVDLLEKRSANEGKASFADWLAVLGAAAAFVGVLAAAIWAIAALIHWIFQ